MKVRIDETIEVSDDQRVKLADVIDDETTKRMAGRNEAREYIRRHGTWWPNQLASDWSERFGADEEADVSPGDGFDLL